MGRLIESYARDCQWHTQLVGGRVRLIRRKLTMFGSQLLNEIMPMIYKRFTEKAAEEWRQIYKVGEAIG